MTSLGSSLAAVLASLKQKDAQMAVNEWQVNIMRKNEQQIVRQTGISNIMTKCKLLEERMCKRILLLTSKLGCNVGQSDTDGLSLGMKDGASDIEGAPLG